MQPLTRSHSFTNLKPDDTRVVPAGLHPAEAALLEAALAQHERPPPPSANARALPAAAEWLLPGITPASMGQTPPGGEHQKKKSPYPHIPESPAAHAGQTDAAGADAAPAVPVSAARAGVGASAEAAAKVDGGEIMEALCCPITQVGAQARGLA